MPNYGLGYTGPDPVYSPDTDTQQLEIDNQESLDSELGSRMITWAHNELDRIERITSADNINVDVDGDIIDGQPYGTIEVTLSYSL